MGLAYERISILPDLELQQGVKTLQKGGLLVFPTDSLWSLGCDATNREAVRTLLHLKGRPVGKPVTLLASSVEMIRQYVEHLHPRIETLLYYHIRPLTIIHNLGKNLPPEVLGPDGSVAIRLAQDEYSRILISQFGKPIVATAACLESQPYPAHFGAISSSILEKVQFVAKYRQSDKTPGAPCVIARLNDQEDELVFLRD